MYRLATLYICCSEILFQALCPFLIRLSFITELYYTCVYIYLYVYYVFFPDIGFLCGLQTFYLILQVMFSLLIMVFNIQLLILTKSNLSSFSFVTYVCCKKQLLNSQSPRFTLCFLLSSYIVSALAFLNAFWVKICVSHGVQFQVCLFIYFLHVHIPWSQHHLLGRQFFNH